MRVIDIFDSDRQRAAALSANVAARLGVMAGCGEVDMAAVRNRTDIGSIAELGIPGATSSFGFMSRFSLPSVIRRLAGNHRRVVVHTYSLPVAEQAVMTGRSLAPYSDVRVVAELRTGESPSRLSASARYAARGVDGFIFPTSVDRDMMYGLPDMTLTGKNAVIPPGAALVRDGGLTVNEEDRSHINMLWIGSITPESRLGDVVEAMGLLAGVELRLIVAGQGEARSAVPLLRRVKALGLEGSIDFEGAVALSPSLLSRADAVILPSPSDPCNPDTAAIAMNSGLPLVMADSPRNRAIAGGRDVALFFEPMSPQSLAESLRILCMPDNRRADMSRMALATASELYSTGRSAEAVIRFYNRLF